jgi:ABC-2 type transport system ATP-binding protein
MSLRPEPTTDEENSGQPVRLGGCHQRPLSSNIFGKAIASALVICRRAPVARIEVRGLTKRFGNVVAVDDLSFTVEEGSVTGFLGPNGAGKTTTLRVLLGLVRPTAGQALVNGRAYRDLDDPTHTVGAVLESSGFHPARTARNHLRTIAIVDGVPDARVDEVLELVGLSAEAHRRVGGYSMGMRQRLELARALLGDPEILILDEPANGLDPQGIAWLRGFLRSFASRGRVVLISSHLLAEAAQTVDKVIVVNHGRMAGQGPLAQLRQGGTTTVRVRSPDASRLAALLASAGIATRREGDEMVEATGTTAEAVGKLMAEHQIVVLEMSTSGESLEQLFFELTASGDKGGLEPLGFTERTGTAS